jgi:hypothetical protein
MTDAIHTDDDRRTVRKEPSPSAGFRVVYAAMEVPIP